MSDLEVNYGKRVVVSSPDFNLGGAVHQINKDKKTDLGFYRETVKLFFVLFGKIKVVIMENGKMAAMEVDSGKSFAIRPGLIFQLEGLQDSIVIEYSSKMSSDKDYHLISKGSLPEEESSSDFVTKREAPESLSEPVETVSAEKPKRKTRRKKKTKTSRS